MLIDIAPLSLSLSISLFNSSPRTAQRHDRVSPSNQPTSQPTKTFTAALGCSFIHKLIIKGSAGPFQRERYARYTVARATRSLSLFQRDRSGSRPRIVTEGKESRFARKRENEKEGGKSRKEVSAHEKGRLLIYPMQGADKKLSFIGFSSHVFRHFSPSRGFYQPRMLLLVLSMLAEPAFYRETCHYRKE